MKFLKITGLTMLALGMAACSNDEPINPNEGNENTVAKYMVVNLVTTPEASRAGDPKPDGAQYEEGTKNENAITQVRFYFFGSDGAACNVDASNSINYYDWTPAYEDKDMPNVEQMLSATIVISSKSGYGPDATNVVPKKIFAVLNPDAANLPAGSISANTLRAVMANYASKANDDNIFVMSNSTYVKAFGATNNIVNLVDIPDECVVKDPAAALQNPVNIYVERTMAKVRLNYGDDCQPDANGRIALKDKDGNNITVNIDGTDTQVYFQATGWDLTATTHNAYLSKHVGQSWSADLMGTQPWNYAPYFRSFWALNPALADAGQDYFSFSSISAKTIGGESNFKYTNENAGSHTTTQSDFLQRVFPTQVIISGKVCTEAGAALEIIQYGSERFVGEDNLITAMLANLHIWKRVVDTSVEPNEVHYVPLTADDVQLVTTMTSGSALAGQENSGRYKVELTWAGHYTKNAATNAWTNNDNCPTDWCTSNREGTMPASKADIERAFRSVGDAKVYKDGANYYYFKIKHLGNYKPSDSEYKGDAFGEYGVVRNHIYDCKITKIQGLGTPVYDPEETVYPEKPKDDDDTFIAAAINILSWRVVSQDVDLDW